MEVNFPNYTNKLEELGGTYVYYARPYCSGDKGTNETKMVYSAAL